MQRRRHRLMMRRTTVRGSSRRRSLTTAFVVVVGAFAIMIGGSVLGTAGGLLAAYNYFASGLPQPNVLDNLSLPQSSYVYDRTGKTLLARFECQNRDTVTFDQIPPYLVDATVATEDRTFWTNDGVDYSAAIAAMYANIKAGGIVRGASTLTQQMIDYAAVLSEQQGVEPSAPAASQPITTSLPPDPSAAPSEPTAAAEEEVCTPPAPRQHPGIDDKIREQIFAREVTAQYPGVQGKKRILTTYLNLVYYGNGSYGVKAAAANYFGITDLSQLTLAQSAFLAGLPQLPSVYDPYQNPNGEPGFGAGRRGRHRAPDAGPRLDAPRCLYHEGAARRGERGHVDRDEPEPGVEPAARAAFHVPGAKRGGAHPRQRSASRTRRSSCGPAATRSRPRSTSASRSRPTRRSRSGSPRCPTRTSATARWSPSTRPPARSSPTSDRSTTTTARTPASMASSTSPDSDAGSPARPSSRSPTAQPSRPARRRRRRSSSTRSRSSGRPSRRPTSRPTPTSTTTGRCSPPTRCATASTCRR